MLYKAIKSFSGVVSMAAGEVREIASPEIVTDLLKAGYIIEYKADTDTKDENPKKKKARAVK